MGFQKIAAAVVGLQIIYLTFDVLECALDNHDLGVAASVAMMLFGIGIIISTLSHHFPGLFGGNQMSNKHFEHADHYFHGLFYILAGAYLTGCRSTKIKKHNENEEDH